MTHKCTRCQRNYKRRASVVRDGNHKLVCPYCGFPQGKQPATGNALVARGFHGVDFKSRAAGER